MLNSNGVSTSWLFIPGGVVRLRSAACSTVSDLYAHVAIYKGEGAEVYSALKACMYTSLLYKEKMYLKLLITLDEVENKIPIIIL